MPSSRQVYVATGIVAVNESILPLPDARSSTSSKIAPLELSNPSSPTAPVPPAFERTEMSVWPVSAEIENQARTYTVSSGKTAEEPSSMNVCRYAVPPPA